MAKETGTLTRKELAGLLNEDLAREYQAIIAYVVYSQVLKGAKYMSIADQLETHAAEELKHALSPGEPLGYLRGKALMRDVLVHQKAYSELEAEELVDTLELQGYLHFLGDPSERSVADAHWDIHGLRINRK